MTNTRDTIPAGEPFERSEWHERTPHLWRRLFRSAVIDVIVLLALFAAGELAVQGWVPDSGRYLYSRTLTAGHPIVVNSRGLRERGFPARRPPGQTRILCVGDSVTFGSGVAVEDAWPRQLEGELLSQPPSIANQAATGSVFVINGATQGKPLSRAIEFVRREGFALDPSLVVVGFSPAMIGRAYVEAGVSGQSRRGPVPVLSTTPRVAPFRRAVNFARSVATSLHALGRSAFELLHERSHFYTLAAAEYRRLLFTLGIRQKAVDDPNGGLLAYAFDSPGVDRERVERAYDLVREQLAGLKAELDLHGIPLAVVSIPSRFELSDEACDNEFGLACGRIRIRPHDRIDRFCRELDVTFVDLLPALKRRRAAMLSGGAAWDDLYVSQDDAHLNESGCRIAAKTLATTLHTDHRLAGWRKRHLFRRLRFADHIHRDENRQ